MSILTGNYTNPNTTLLKQLWPYKTKSAGSDWDPSQYRWAMTHVLFSVLSKLEEKKKKDLWLFHDMLKNRLENN